eukprot:s10410_g1.t1
MDQPKDPLQIESSDSEEAEHDAGVAADLQEERCWLHPQAQEPAQQAKAKAQAEVAKEQVENAKGPMGLAPESKGTEGEDGPPADGAEGKGGPPASKDKPATVSAPCAETKKATGPGAAARSNFAGRSPPNTSPFIDRFLATKDVWVKFLGHDMFRVQYAYA